MGRKNKKKRFNPQDPEVRKRLLIEKNLKLQQDLKKLEADRASGIIVNPIIKPKASKNQQKNKAKRDNKKWVYDKRLHKSSIGESNIIKHLRNLKIRFEIEKTFNGLINPLTKEHLRFDFYIPKFNTCIEFDGAQHFIYVKEFHGEDEDKGRKKLEYQKYKDKVKNEFCKNNNIGLLRISYLDIDNVHTKINNYLKGLKQLNE